MKCKFCGQENPDGVKFCSWCGEKISTENDIIPTSQIKDETTIPIATNAEIISPKPTKTIDDTQSINNANVNIQSNITQPINNVNVASNSQPFNNSSFVHQNQTNFGGNQNFAPFNNQGQNYNPPPMQNFGNQGQTNYQYPPNFNQQTNKSDKTIIIVVVCIVVALLLLCCCGLPLAVTLLG